MLKVLRLADPSSPIELETTLMVEKELYSQDYLSASVYRLQHSVPIGSRASRWRVQMTTWTSL